MGHGFDVRIICDYREAFPSACPDGFFNDHQDKGTFLAIEGALLQAGYECSLFGGVPQLLEACNEGRTYPNTLFVNLSDGMFQQYSRTQVPILCDLLEVHYTGGNPFTVSLATNKHYAKATVADMGLLVPEGILLDRDGVMAGTAISEKTRCIVKPNAEGSSMGIFQSSICDTYSKAYRLGLSMLDEFEEVVIEPYLEGYDATVFVVGNKNNIVVNEVLVIEHHGKLFFDNEVVSILDYAQHGTRSVPASGVLPTDVIDDLKRSSELIAVQLKTYDIARIDYRVTVDGRIYFLEINTVPAVHSDSQAGAVCAALKIELGDFLDLFVTAAAKRLGLS